MNFKKNTNPFIGTVQFNHKEGCQKCTVIGKTHKRPRRTSYTHTDCELRTDHSFRQRIHPNHHKEYSLIERLPVDMISQFITSDPLHLIELGITKKYSNIHFILNIFIKFH